MSITENAPALFALTATKLLLNKLSIALLALDASVASCSTLYLEARHVKVH